MIGLPQLSLLGFGKLAHQPHLNRFDDLRGGLAVGVDYALFNKISVQTRQINDKPLLRSEFLSGGRGCAGAGEERVVHSPAGAGVWKIGEHQRRLRDQVVDGGAIDCAGIPFTFAKQDVVGLPTDGDNIDLRGATPMAADRLRLE